MTQDSTILTNREGGVLVVTLNRPDRLNAFTPQMHGELADSLKVAETDDAVRAILLTGAGRGFCAGQDLGERDPGKMDGPPDLGETIEQFYNPLIRRIRALAKPVVCAVNGVAAGAGANIALACDIVLAGESAKFIEAFSKIGLVPDSGGTWTLTRILGEQRAKAMTMLAEPVDAATAERWGLIWKAVPDAELKEKATAVAAKLAAGPTLGLGLTKRAINQANTFSLDESLDLERDFQRQAGRSEDYAEGVSAFLEKREAKFSGK